LDNGTGFIPETTPENFCQNRGGYNCRHTCYPVRNPNKITEKGNVKENVDPVISKKEQTELIGLAKYTNAKTVSEAKDNSINIFKDNLNFNIKSVSYSDKLSIEDINLMNKELYNLTNEYNSSFSKDSEIDLNFKKESNIVLGSVEYFLQSGKINKIYLGELSSDPGRTQKRYENGIFANKSKVDKENLKFSVLYHEFGHIISVNEINNNDTTFIKYWSDMKKLYTKYRKEIKSTYINKGDLENVFLGNYANTNIREFMAEGFTEYKLSSNPSKFAIEIGKLIDKYFKK
jgi:hypothetical protein